METNEELLETVKRLKAQIQKAQGMIEMIEQAWRQEYNTANFKQILEIKRKCDEERAQLEEKKNELITILRLHGYE